MGRFTYRAFGLIFESEFPCPVMETGSGTPDVRIEFGIVPAELPGEALADGDSVLCQARPSQCLLRMDGVADYLIHDGNHMVVRPAPGASMDAIRVFLYSTAFGALLHQRRLLPLHGSAVATPDGAILLLGPSGCGKSTLACALHKAGFPLIADDICSVDLSDEFPQIVPGLPLPQLWLDSIQALALSGDSAYAIRPGLRKYRLHSFSRTCSAPLPVHAIYILNVLNAAEHSLVELRGVPKIEALTRNTFRRTLIERMDLQESHFIQTSKLASRVTVREVRRPTSPMRVEELMARVLQGLPS